ncbi:MAG: 3-hydroxyacyl-CoA dehydrogenase NAD-binding domain-containing protein, partial [bacterium]
DMEATLFAELADSEQARALVGNFMNDQYVKRVSKKYAKQSTLVLDKTAVIGAGIMGGGIAYQNALQGMPVVMKDIADNALDLGMSEATKLLSKKVSQGRMTEEQKSEILGKITPSLEMDDVTGAKVIVEAVVENPKVKEMVLAELEDQLAEGG